MIDFSSIFKTTKPIIGMIHLPALPGSPQGYHARFSELSRFALSELEALQKGGVDGVIVENFWDIPYFPNEVPCVTIASIAAIAGLVVEKSSIPVGINVLYNDYHAEIAIARAVGAAFIRAEVFVDPSISETGLLEASAPYLLRERMALGAEYVAILADIQGKNTSTLWHRGVLESARDAEERGLADAIVVTGSGTGQPVTLEDLQRIKQASHIPILAGSGVSLNSIPDLFVKCDGAIVGSFFKQGGILTAPTDKERVKELMCIVRRCR